MKRVKMMLRTMVLLLTILFPLAVMAQGGYIISGKMSRLNVPAKVYLAFEQPEGYKDKDSTVTKNGKFQFNGSVVMPTQALIRIERLNSAQIKNRPDQLDLFIENSNISVSGTDSVKNASVTGSITDREERNLTAAVQPLTNAIISLNQEYRGKPKDAAYKKASDSVTRLVAGIKNIRLQFVESHLNSFVGLYTYNLYILDAHFDPAKVEPIFHRFSPVLQSSDLGKRAFSKIEVGKRRQTGVKATDFTQNDINGKPFKLSSLRGKYILVDFWASWCVPCRAENPNLVKAYQQLKQKNFEVVGVSLDQNKGSWENAVKQDKLPWIHVCDLKGWKNEVALTYGINAVPQNMLINPDGVIIAKNLRGEDLTAKLSALIK